MILIPIVQEANTAEGAMGLSQHGIECDRTRRRLLSSWHDRLWTLEALQPEHVASIAQPSPGEGIMRIKCNGAVKTVCRPPNIQTSSVEQSTAF